MKISNETKVGALAAVAITLLILGFNFLKGRNLFSNAHRIYAKYANVSGLGTSNPVMINGLQVGTVYDIKPLDKNVDTILVTLNLTRDINIPDNSVAAIATPLLGTPEVDLRIGNSTRLIQVGDTIQSQAALGLMDNALKTVDPVLTQVGLVLHSVDSVLNKFSDILDPRTKGNLRDMIASFSKDASALTVTLNRVNGLLDKENGSLSKTMDNLDSFTGNLAKNNDALTGTLQNLKKTTDQLADGNLGKTLEQLKTSTAQLQDILTKVNNGSGSVGALLNDKTLYNKLNSTVRSINTLVDDLKLHPKRYVNITVFGKKDRSTPLKAPLSEDSTQH
ncbi:MlaD family protein [Dinghuibacter silviterrae]|uniref:Phospholipid/cholesterol/gamma-HCH transport system substrate-binding protein n=1 Tax=Dinghuibacter silviterrae TaxID=1539049 RepID=A0A4R8DHP2_9BACT|nr:MlaD family protein [Dinghuibacter silviterrae]TDW97055.1 phospholipid/cholesterol/gamma-HCH transport system substrate-binding protein [Dinghuibacter silviterrae]